MIRYGSDIYFFHNVPPTEKGSEVSKSRRPNPPFPGAELWQSSVYYYWWLFLRENADYVATCENGGDGPCAQVYRDFGDVRLDDFPTWWKIIGRELFCEPRSHSVAIASDYVKRPFTELSASPDTIIINFDDGADLEKVLAETQNVIKAHYRGKFGRPGTYEKESGALYPVFTKPVIQSLHQHHVALQLSKQEKGLKFHDIAKMSGAYATQGDADVHWRKIAGNIGFREIRQAETMVKYVAQGVFPVMTPEHEAEVEAFLRSRQENSQARRKEVKAGEFAVQLGPLARSVSD